MRLPASWRTKATLRPSGDQSGSVSIARAAECGLPYAFADFINPSGADYAAHYRATFTPSRWRSQPETLVAVWVVCADSDEEARRLAASSVMSFRLLQRGQLIPVPPVEKAIAFLDADGPRASHGLPMRTRRRVVGSPESVKSGLEDVAARVSGGRTDDRNDHLRSRSAPAIVQLVADAFALRS